jgi:hypothetical protein
MAQRELKKKQAKSDTLDRVPAKIGFLDQLDAELTYAGYRNVGYVAGGAVSATYGPLTVGVGGGTQKIEYYPKPQFYASPRLRVQGILGDFELYLVGNASIVPKIGKNGASRITYKSAGAVWEPVSPQKGNKMSFRLGVEGKYIREWAPSSTAADLKQGGAGASIGYGPVTAYAIENILFYQKKPYEQTFPDNMKAHQHKIKAGVVVDYGEVQIKGEFSHTALEMEGRFSVTAKTKHLTPEAYVWYSKGEEMLGEDKAGIGLNLAFGWQAFNARAKVEGGFDMGGSDGGEIGEWGLNSSYEERAFKDAIRDSGNISEFAAKYSGKGTESILYAAIQLGYHGYEGYELVSLNEEKKLAAEGEFKKIRERVLSGKGTGGVCVNIGSVQAEFLRKVGWKAYNLDIAIKGGGHHMAVAKNPETGEAYLLRKSVARTNPRGNILPLIREYAKEKNVIARNIYIYGAGNKLVGYYELEEGKLNRAMAGEEVDTLEKALLHSRPKKRKR